QGVLVEGLGTFCTVKEPLLLSEEEVLWVRRPIFKLAWQMLWPGRLTSPEVIIPDDVTIEPLNYLLLSLVTSLPWRVVEDCVKETILFFSFHLENKRNVAFAFRDIGVLMRRRDRVCMLFYASCIQRLEKRASLLAALRS
ncbi:CCD81 protein, partial [Crypturellus undulatus]|nr:CCD81 protein [Crypturellus undulatus]